MDKVYCHRTEAQLFFKCKWCGKYHYHGLGNGIRASHCSKHKEDYEVIEAKEAEKNYDI